MTRRRSHGAPRRYWSEAEDATMRRLFPHGPTKDVLAQLPGRSIASVRCRAHTLGLQKTAEFMASPAAYRLDGITGAKFRFEKGHVPWSKGRKGYDAGGRSHLTRFKRGDVPQTWVPVGTTVKRSDGYWQEKVGEPNEWRMVHRMAWEQAHGPIPRNSVLKFRDGNTDNYDLANLELITRGQLMLKNSFHNYPQPIPRLIQLRGALVRKINRRKQAHEEQA